MIRILLILLTGLLINPLFSQVKVVPASNAQPSATASGIFYALPMTYFKIDVTVKKTENIPGPYSDYAAKYLGLENVISIQSDHYEIVDVNLTPFTRPDPDHVYFVEFGERSSKEEKSISLNLSDAGLIVGVNKISPTVGATSLVLENETADGKVPELFKQLAAENLFEKVDTTIRRINIDTLTIEKYFYKSSWREKSTEQKARDAADFISRIKENRFLLISGYQEVNYGESIRYMDEQLQKLHDEYLSLFTGVKITRMQSYSYIFLPEPELLNSPQAVFKFSTTRGAYDLSENIGENVYIRIESSGIRESVSGYVDALSAGISNKGYFYRIPEYGDISIRYGSRKLYRANLMIDQLGLVTFTPSFDSEIEFHQNTGGIKSIHVE